MTDTPPPEAAQPKRKPGRPTRLNAAVQARIVEAVRVGVTYEAAAVLGGISYATFNDWMEKGRAAKSGVYLQFVQAIEEANAYAEQAIFAQIRKANNDGDWRAGAWMLTHSPRFKESYADTTKMQADITWRERAQAEGVPQDTQERAYQAAYQAAYAAMRAQTEQAQEDAPSNGIIKPEENTNG